MAIAKLSSALEIELVPATMWGRNVRGVVSTDNWEALRYRFGASSTKPQYYRIPSRPKSTKDLKCYVCSTIRSSLELHEVWRFDDTRRIQKLVKLVPLCRHCHLAKHFGYAQIIGEEEGAFEHLRKLNGWKIKEARNYINACFEKWRERSQHSYKLDLSFLHKHIGEGKVHHDWLDSNRVWFRSRAEAIRWARTLDKATTVIVDTETTGLFKYNPDAEIVELAILTLSGTVLYNSLMKPIGKMPREAYAVHGIAKSHVLLSPKFRDESRKINEILKGKTVISYNAKFDREIFGSTARLHNVDAPDCRWECAMHAFSTYQGKSHSKLPNGKHRALADCRATLRLIRKMARTPYL